MSPVELALPVVGILAILALVWLTGGLQSASIADTDAAKRRLAEDAPGLAVAEAVLAQDRRIALLAATGDAAFALVFAAGNKLATRVLKPAALRAVAAEGTALTLATDDFGRHRFRLELGDAAMASAWAARLESFRAQAHSDAAAVAA